MSLSVFNGSVQSDGFALFFEWSRAVFEINTFEVKTCIENAAKILIKFFENTDCKLDAQCMEVYLICEYLAKEGLHALRQRLLELFLIFVNNIGDKIEEHENHKNETSYVSEHPNIKLCAFSHAYLLTGDKKISLRRGRSIGKNGGVLRNVARFSSELYQCTLLRYFFWSDLPVLYLVLM